jgi:hypothetical protein
LSEQAERAAEQVIANHLGLVVDGPALLREWYARAGRELPAELAAAKTMDEVASVAA